MWKWDGKVTCWTTGRRIFRSCLKRIGQRFPSVRLVVPTNQIGHNDILPVLPRQPAAPVHVKDVVTHHGYPMSAWHNRRRVSTCGPRSAPVHQAQTKLWSGICHPREAPPERLQRLLHLAAIRPSPVFRSRKIATNFVGGQSSKCGKRDGTTPKVALSIRREGIKSFQMIQREAVAHPISRKRGDDVLAKMCQLSAGSGEAVVSVFFQRVRGAETHGVRRLTVPLFSSNPPRSGAIVGGGKSRFMGGFRAKLSGAIINRAIKSSLNGAIIKSRHKNLFKWRD
jgi:hypothetical protein